jgi:hypothetical protein
MSMKNMDYPAQLSRMISKPTFLERLHISDSREFPIRQKKPRNLISRAFNNMAE